MSPTSYPRANPNSPLIGIGWIRCDFVASNHRETFDLSNSERVQSPTPSNKLAVVTGGTRGIGFAVATALADAGYDLILTHASDQDRASDAVRYLRSRLPAISVSALRADSADLEAIDTIERAVSSHGNLTALVLNAGVTKRGQFEDLTVSDWETSVTTNLTFPLFMVQRLLPHFKPGASVCFTGSIMGIYPHSLSLPYGVTKAATHAMVENLVKFLSPYGVRVNAIAPGFIDTEWQQTKPPGIRASIESKIALGRFADPKELGQVYLMALENPYLNGEVIKVDGAYSFE